MGTWVLLSGRPRGDGPGRMRAGLRVPRKDSHSVRDRRPSSVSGCRVRGEQRVPMYRFVLDFPAPWASLRSFLFGRFGLGFVGGVAFARPVVAGAEFCDASAFFLRPVDERGRALHGFGASEKAGAWHVAFLSKCAWYT